MASLGRGTNLKEMESGGGEGKDGIITETKEMDKKTEGKGTEAQLGFSGLNSKQETLMISDGW